MLGALSRWLERRRRYRAAVAVAVRHFETTTGESAHQGASDVIGEDNRGAVVRICYGQVRPSRRAWYVVGADGSVVGELSFAEVGRFGERPWR